MHDKVRSVCIECKGASICPHDKLKYNCIECKGPNICIHNKIKHYCSDCKGAGICIHEKQKGKCKICSPAPCDRCGGVYAGKGNLKRHQLKWSIESNISTEQSV